jgi:hypothetical protein
MLLRMRFVEPKSDLMAGLLAEWKTLKGRGEKVKTCKLTMVLAS